jgi:branched-chain amino acid transport system substrate-binding protein
MNTITKLFLVLLFVGLLVSCSEEQEEKILPSGNSVKIGFIGPMSGPDKVLGKDTLKGIKTALHMHPYLNNGDTINLLVEDDKNEPELTVKALKKLVETDKVAAVIIASSSASGLAVNDIADQYQTPVVILLATHPDISKETKFVSQICFDNKFQARVAALFVRDELLLERVAVFKNPDSYHSNSLSEEFIRKFRSIEGQISDVILVSSKTVDYGEILSRLRDQDVQLLYMPMAVENVIEISKKSAEMGWAPKAMGGDGLLTRALAEKKEEAHYLEGFFATDLFSHTDKLTPYGKRATEVYRSLYKSKASTYTAIGVEGMAILMNGINRCQDASNRACINDKLHATVDFEGIMGNITIQSDGKTLRPLVVNSIKEDQMEFVVKVY